jgi:uncharacterized protein (DUF697 family)
LAETGAVLAKTGRAQYYPYTSKKGKIDIFDTRGLGDRTKPETANFQNAIDEVKAVVEKDYPDIILFLCRAKDVDSYIDIDVKNMAEIQKYIYNKHKVDVTIIGVVTNVDELEPKRVEPPYYDNPKKKENIEIAVNAVKNALASVLLNNVSVVPTSAYAEYDDQNTIQYHNYWNINVLIDCISEALPESTKLEFVRLMPHNTSEQTKLANILISIASTITGVLGAAPIPVPDIVPITATQMVMIATIAYISGRELTYITALELTTALGINITTALLARLGVRQIIKLVPGGFVVSALIAASGTTILGQAAIQYFIEGKSTEEVKKYYDNGMRGKNDQSGEQTS